MNKLMRELKNVHYVAEQFLKDYKATQAQEYYTASLETRERCIILIRDRIPEYFCGYKSDSKTAVWSHDIRYAKSIKESQAESWIDHLAHKGETVFPMWNGVGD